MKKVILIVSIPLLLLGCNDNRSGGSTANTNATNPDAASFKAYEPESNASAQCLENEELVNGVCVCASGLVGGLCPTLTKLATPYIEGLDPITTGPGNSDWNWGFYYDSNGPVKDVNGVNVPSGVTRTAYLYTGTDGNYCNNTYFGTLPPMSCDDGLVYSGGISVPDGCFCVRAINCADGYQKSNTYNFTVCVSGYDGGLEGEDLIGTVVAQ